MYKSLPILMLAIISFTVASIPDEASNKWLTLIKKKHNENCLIGKPNVDSSLVGNNGIRIEFWTLSTCEGVKRYQVSYYPKAYFPNRVTEFAVKLKE